jgi:hypothetical protein
VAASPSGEHGGKESCTGDQQPGPKGEKKRRQHCELLPCIECHERNGREGNGENPAETG